MIFYFSYKAGYSFPGLKGNLYFKNEAVGTYINLRKLQWGLCEHYIQNQYLGETIIIVPQAKIKCNNYKI